MKVIINNRSNVPIYEQIKQQLKEAIFSGALQADDMLPSIRKLARDLQVSVITTTRAYNDLEAEGFIVSVQGKGCFVLPQNQELARENALHKIEIHFQVAIDIAKRGRITYEECNQILKLLFEEENNNE